MHLQNTLSYILDRSRLYTCLSTDQAGRVQRTVYLSD